MANPAHVALLSSGVDAWNQWRKANPTVKPDLSHANLAHADLQGMNLRAANLRAADCTGANFAGADLADADLSNARLLDAILKWADSRGTAFAGAVFKQDPAMSLHLVTSLVARGAIALSPTPSVTLDEPE